MGRGTERWHECVGDAGSHHMRIASAAYRRRAGSAETLANG